MFAFTEVRVSRMGTNTLVNALVTRLESTVSTRQRRFATEAIFARTMEPADHQFLQQNAIAQRASVAVIAKSTTTSKQQ